MNMPELTLQCSGERLEEPCHSLKKSWPSLLNTDGDITSLHSEQGADCSNRKLLVMHTAEVVNVGEPSAEELVGPALRLKDVKTENRVVVDSVDDHLHQVEAVRLGASLLGVDHSHGELNEERNVLVDVTTEVEHKGLGEFAATDTVYAADLVIAEDILNHSNDGAQICWVLNQHIGAVRDVVVESRQHIWEI